RMTGMQWSSTSRAALYHAGISPPFIPAQAIIRRRGRHYCALSRKGRGHGRQYHARGSLPRGRADCHCCRRHINYDNSCSCPPTGISVAVLLVVITRSKRSPLRCHCPATSGVLVTFFTGWPVHFTGPTIDL